MKKSVLKKIPYLNADEKDREFLMLYGHLYLAKPECLVAEGQKILLLNIYEREQLLKGNMIPMYRVFEGKKEFITEITALSQWTLHTLNHLIYDGRERPNIVFRKKCEENIVKRFFREGKTKKRALDIFHREQEKIKKRERLERKRKRKR